MAKIKILDSAFLPYSNSASLREENAHVHPTHFQWEYSEGDYAFCTDGHIRNIREGAIAWLIEPRHLRPENYALIDDPEIRGRIKAFLTYDRELITKYPDKGLFYPFGGSSIAFDKWGKYHKTRHTCMFVSDKNVTEGHKLRHRIVREQPDNIDFYGAGVGNPVESKFEILKDYDFCVVVESAQSSDYFTEKLIDPISVGTFPVYYGCPKIQDFFSAPLYDFADFSCYVRHYHRQLDKDVYSAFSEAAKKYRICEDWIYKQHPQLFGGTI